MRLLIVYLFPFNCIIEPEGGDETFPLGPALLGQGALLGRTQDVGHPRIETKLNKGQGRYNLVRVYNVHFDNSPPPPYRFDLFHFRWSEVYNPKYV